MIALPALHGEGIALVTIDLAPCGINIPHVHTRATEFLYAIDAESVSTPLLQTPMLHAHFMLPLAKILRVHIQTISHSCSLLLLHRMFNDQVQTTFVEENGGRGAITNTIATGQAAFFPKGLVHYQYNTSCKPARLLAALGHEDFGVQTVSTTALANLPTEGLAAALGITQADLTGAIAKFPANPAQSAECLQRCKAAGSLP